MSSDHSLSLWLLFAESESLSGPTYGRKEHGLPSPTLARAGLGHDLRRAIRRATRLADRVGVSAGNLDHHLNYVGTVGHASLVIVGSECVSST